MKKMRIIGLDPGSRIAGFACLETDPTGHSKSKVKICDAGSVRFKQQLDFSSRIGALHKFVDQLIQDFRPDICVIEKAFYGVNVNTAIKLGEARGAIISASYRHQVKLHHVTPAEVKKFLTGNGRASKEEVSLAVKTLTGFERKNLSEDTTDAIAIALFFCLQNMHSSISQQASD